MITTSLEPLLTSPAMLISATNQLGVQNICASHSVPVSAITNGLFCMHCVSSVRFISLVQQDLKIIPRFCKIMCHRNQEDLSNTSLYCSFHVYFYSPLNFKAGKEQVVFYSYEVYE